MQIAVYFTMLLLMITKLMDVFTTLVRIKSPNQEKNPAARYVIKRFGTATTVWGVFALSLLIIVPTGIFALRMSEYYKIMYTLLGFLISIIQLEVARSNWTGNLNPVAVRVDAIYRKFSAGPCPRLNK